MTDGAQNNTDHQVPIFIPWVGILAGWTIGFRQLALAYKLASNPTRPPSILLDAVDAGLLDILKALIGVPLSFYLGAACIGISGLLVTFGPIYLKYSWSKTHLVSRERNGSLRKSFLYLYPPVVFYSLSMYCDILHFDYMNTVFTILFYITGAYWLFLA